MRSPSTETPRQNGVLCGASCMPDQIDDSSPVRLALKADAGKAEHTNAANGETVALLQAEIAEQRQRLLALEEIVKQTQKQRNQPSLSPRSPSERISGDVEEGLPNPTSPPGHPSTPSGRVSGGSNRGSKQTSKAQGPSPSTKLQLPIQKTLSGNDASNQPQILPGSVVASRSSGLEKPTKKIFDQDFLKTIYAKPYRKARQKGAMIGGGVLGIMSMPFGPIGMVAGGTFGAAVGGVVGLFLDRRKAHKEIQESEAQKRKLKSLVRWALDHFHEDDEFINIIEMVTLEFKPMADIADGSKHARKLLKLLDGWIAQKKVTRNLWVYMDVLLQRWRDLNRGDFMRSMLVFQTLTTMYRYSQRVLDEQEIQFLHRMERLLEHDSVKLIMQHVQTHPTEDATRLMECMVYADALGTKKKKRDVGAGAMSPHGTASPSASDHEEELESSDDESKSTSTKGSIIGNVSGLLIRSNSRPSNDGSKELPTPGKVLAEESTPSVVVPQKVLKKPFFKDWDDFMGFDCTFKRKMPITLSEFDLLQQKADEPLKGWDVCVDRKEIKVAKTQNDTGCITLRAWATVPGVDLMVAFFLFADHKERVKWDKVFAVMDLIETNLQGSEIVYSLMKVPAVTARDFLQYRRCKIMEDGSIHIVLRSAEHPNMPEQKGAIRAESYIAGYILQQSYEGNTPVLNIFLMTCVDIKGLIPKWVINATAPRKPAEWVDNLKKAAMEYQAAHPNFKDQLVETLARYKEENPYDFEEVAEGATDAAELQAVGEKVGL